MLERYVRSRRTDRMAGIAFTHGLVDLFGNDLPFVRWSRGLALTMLDAIPAAKRAFTRAMLFGLRLATLVQRAIAARRRLCTIQETCHVDSLARRREKDALHHCASFAERL